MAAEPIAASPQEFDALLAKDRERFGTIVREAKIKAQQ
jgi:tripartite-type tricarboxylate transporter receptor subunit TctC